MQEGEQVNILMHVMFNFTGTILHTSYFKVNNVLYFPVKKILYLQLTHMSSSSCATFQWNVKKLSELI